MQLTYCTCLWVTLVSALISCSYPRKGIDERPLPIADRADSFIEEGQQVLNPATGLAIAIYTPEGTYTKGFGMADINTGEAVTTDTAFYIASSTKSFVALALNTLHQRGELDLDTNLASYAPDAPFPDAVYPQQVTLRQMLTHSSGIENDPISFRSAYSGDHSPALLRQLRIWLCGLSVRRI